MHECSRRDFMARTAAVAGTVALGAERLWAAPASASGNSAKMSIAKWQGAEKLSESEMRNAAVKLTEQAIEGLGGLKRFVGRGSVVWVKPNIGWDRAPELAANTNPDVVATIVRLCFEAGAKAVKVGDNSCDLPAKAYPSSGIPDAIKPLGAEMVYLDRSRFRETAIGGERVKSIPIHPAILETDLVINVPIVKHHRLATSTLCMKNYMGVIEKRNVFHQDIPTCLVDITRFMKPQICILDAVRILVDHGPKGGDPADVRVPLTVAAGTDIVALDAWGVEVMGKKAAEIPSIVKGVEAGLGKMDFRSLTPREIRVS